MPTYDYFCEANERTVEVQHGISERISTWGELCARAGVPPGRTAPGTPVQKLATGGTFIRSASLGSGTAPADCDAGPACCGGGCPALN
jgi:hypothetical protein